MHVVKFTTKLNNLKSLNQVEKATASLARVATEPQCETEKIRVVNLQLSKNPGTAVQIAANIKIFC